MRAQCIPYFTHVFQDYVVERCIRKFSVSKAGRPPIMQHFLLPFPVQLLVEHPSNPGRMLIMFAGRADHIHLHVGPRDSTKWFRLSYKGMRGHRAEMSGAVTCCICPDCHSMHCVTELFQSLCLLELLLQLLIMMGTCCCSLLLMTFVSSR